MKNIFPKAFLGAVVLVLALGPASPAGAPDTAPKPRFDMFHTNAELTQALKDLAAAYPKLMTLESIGKSYQGRDIWGVTLHNPATGPAERKTGYYIDGNIHGNEVQGTEVALYTIWYLLENYGKTEMATRLLDERVFYIIPTMNPDARDYFLLEPTDSNSPRSGLVPFDLDRDGVADEDGPEDLDGDGSITQMRKRHPYGNMKEHPDDPRILIPVKPGERGEFILLGLEGIDNDGDGLVNEDPPGGYDMNRNFGFNWQPHYVQRGAGDYPFCFPETQAVRDFIMARPNIAGAQSYHNYGAMILRGPGAKNMGDVNPMDKQVYDFIGRKGETILPGYRYMVVYKDLYTVYGGTVDFLYNVVGAYTFTNELDFPQAQPLYPPTMTERFQTQDESGQPGSWMMGFPSAVEEMAYHDLVLMGEMLTDWKPYDHPQFGEIEIGGIKKFGRRVPALFRLAETCHRNAAFTLYHADQLARLAFEDVKISKLPDGFFQVDVRVVNDRVTPSMSAIAVQKKLHRPDRLAVEAKKAGLVAAGRITDEFRGLTQELRVRDNAFSVENGIPGFGQVPFRLLIRGSGEVRLVYDSLKGGGCELTINLK